MLEKEIALLKFARGYADSLIGDIEPGDFGKQPVAGMNSPAWILGHLAYALDRHATFAGGEQTLGAWQELFGKGSPAAANYPPKDEIVAAWHGAVERMIATVESADDAALTAPNPGPLPDAFPTVADFLAFSMAVHTSTHLGQLSAWRRADGRPPLY